MLVLPNKIKNLIGNERFSYDDVGMSDSTVIIFTDKVLKIQSISEESEHEYQVMEWLQDKFPVPRVLAFEKVVKDIWEAVFIMCDLFYDIAKEVSFIMNVKYNEVEANNSLKFLKDVCALPKDAEKIY